MPHGDDEHHEAQPVGEEANDHRARDASYGRKLETQRERDRQIDWPSNGSLYGS